MRSKYHRPTGEHTLTAVLVENTRVNGHPRQHIVTYLGSIGAGRTSYYYHQLAFWKSAQQHIAGLGLDDATISRIRDSLTKVVPMPTPESRAQAFKDLEELTAKIHGV